MSQQPIEPDDLVHLDRVQAFIEGVQGDVAAHRRAAREVELATLRGAAYGAALGMLWRAHKSKKAARRGH